MSGMTWGSPEPWCRETHRRPAATLSDKGWHALISISHGLKTWGNWKHILFTPPEGCSYVPLTALANSWTLVRRRSPATWQETSLHRSPIPPCLIGSGLSFRLPCMSCVISKPVSHMAEEARLIQWLILGRRRNTRILLARTSFDTQNCKTCSAPLQSYSGNSALGI